MEQQFKVNFNFNLLSKSASEENATIRVIVRFGEQRKEVNRREADQGQKQD